MFHADTFCYNVVIGFNISIGKSLIYLFFFLLQMLCLRYYSSMRTLFCILPMVKTYYSICQFYAHFRDSIRYIGIVFLCPCLESFWP